MTDLEERILKKNVPGKYSKWTDYEEENDTSPPSSSRRRRTSRIDDQHDFNHHQLDHVHVHGDNKATTKQQDYYEKNALYNTGIKGILSDHRRAKELERIKLQEEQFDREEELVRKQMTNGSVMNIGEQSISIAFEKQQQRQQQQRHENLHHYSDSDSEEEDDGLNDEYFMLYRQKRLSEILEKTTNSSLPRFGTVTQIDSALQFSTLIDEADERTFLVFHLYDSRIPCCRLMNDHLVPIARDMEYCQYFRMNVSMVKKAFDPMGFPCILVYRAGEEIANLTPIVKLEARDRFTIQDIQEILLQTCGLI
mmetsp:Transcript_13851/g.26077  ORF Transcript_13851/g.26077 Transcript_13851/m.26077 type:complete len:309 (+) Transcript_13851:736-1662(+)